MTEKKKKKNERCFSMKKVAGIFSRSKANKEKMQALGRDILEGTAARGIKNSQYWPFIKSLLTEINDEANKVLKERNAPDQNLRWANNRIETVDEFYTKLEAKIKTGDNAEKTFNKLKEIEDARPKRKNAG